MGRWDDAPGRWPPPAFPVMPIRVLVVPVFVAVVTAAMSSCEYPRNLHIPSFSHSWASQESIVVFLVSRGEPPDGQGQGRQDWARWSRAAVTHPGACRHATHQL